MLLVYTIFTIKVNRKIITPRDSEYIYLRRAHMRIYTYSTSIGFKYSILLLI
nr:MAG TPA: hypothetical protein [Caudoviricetes sp.]